MMVSPAPPAAYGTMTVIGRSGYSAALRGREPAASAAAARMNVRRCRRGMEVFPASSEIDPHQVVGDPQRPLIGSPDVGHERVDLVRPHQLDRQMLCGGALEDRAQGIDVTDMRCDELLDARARGQTTEIARAGVGERPHFGLPPMLNERLGEGTFMDQ